MKEKILHFWMVVDHKRLTLARSARSEARRLGEPFCRSPCTQRKVRPPGCRSSSTWTLTLRCACKMWIRPSLLCSESFVKQPLLDCKITFKDLKESQTCLVQLGSQEAKYQIELTFVVDWGRPRGPRCPRVCPSCTSHRTCTCPRINWALGS